MKRNRKLLISLIMVMICIFMSAPLNTQAAVKLNKTKITICRYHQYKLKLNGTSEKITWKSADPTVATVSKKGNVTAVSAGKTTITAKTGSKKYTCTVTVKEYDAETTLAAYGYLALQDIVPEDSTISIANVWLGSTVANVPFGMLDCTFEDKTGKSKHAYVYAYEQEELSTTCFNTTTQFYEKNLVIKFDNQQMDSIQQTRVTKGSAKKVKEAAKYISALEKTSVSKGKNFNTLNTWLKL